MKSNKFARQVSAFAVLVFAAAASHAAIVNFDIRGKAGSGLLSGNENVAVINGTPGSGGEVGAGIFFDDATNILTLNVGWGATNGFSDLTGAVRVAHLHGPTASNGIASFAENAAIKFNLDGATVGFNGSANSGGWTGTTVAFTSAADVAALLAGRFYLNVHTNANTGGEIRGNLVQVPEPGTVGLVLAGLALVAGMARRRT